MCDDHRDLNLSSRRAFMQALGAGAIGSVALSAAAAAAPMPGMHLAPTTGVDLVKDPQIHKLRRPLIATGQDILGPFWRAGAPMTSSLAPKDAKGQRLQLSGTVRDTQGKPIEGVVLDFWNADDTGLYDLTNPFQQLTPDAYKFRGLVKSDAAGKYAIETIVPGKYRIPPKLPGFEQFENLLRPAHVHLMTSHVASAPLITQIYFKGDPEIAKDPFANKSRNVVTFDKTAEVWKSTFDIVLVRAGA